MSHSHVAVIGPYTRGKAKVVDGIVTAGVAGRAHLVLDRSGFRIGYHSAVFNDFFASDDPPLGSLLGWKRPDLGSYQPRYENAQPASRWRCLMELNVSGAQRGVARGGADLWPVLRDRRGRRRGTAPSRYPHSVWRNLDIPWTLFAPGPTGPVSTHHYEAMREGVQECQARILIEQALTDEELKAKLGADLTARCKALLLERTYLILKAVTHQQLNTWGHFTGPDRLCRQNGIAGHRWFVGSGWQARSEALYALAGEVARKLADK